MTSVALIQLGERHTEIIGGVVSMFLRKGVNRIVVYTTKYESSFVPYYRKLFKRTKRIKWSYIPPGRRKSQLRKKIEKECELYVFLTGAEYEELRLSPQETLLIAHYADDVREHNKWNVCAQIALSPVFHRENIKSFLNVFVERPIRRVLKRLEILIAGLTNPENKDLEPLRALMNRLAENGNRLPSGRTVLFHVINYYPIGKEFGPFEAADLLKVYVDIPAEEMMKILRKSAYTMVLASKNSSYHTHQLSGIIPLSISCGVPLICDRELAKIYHMSRICTTYSFTKDYLYRALKSAGKKDLRLMKERTIAFRDKKVVANRKARIPCLR